MRRLYDLAEHESILATEMLRACATRTRLTKTSRGLAAWADDKGSGGSRYLFFVRRYGCTHERKEWTWRVWIQTLPWPEN